MKTNFKDIYIVVNESGKDATGRRVGMSGSFEAPFESFGDAAKCAADMAIRRDRPYIVARLTPVAMFRSKGVERLDLEIEDKT